MASNNDLDLRAGTDLNQEGANFVPAVSDWPAVPDQPLKVAQADTPAAVPASVTIEVEDGSILRLPDGASIELPRVNGTNLEFVQPDGSVIVVPNGAITGLTIFIGDVEIPPVTVAALFQANDIETAAGPDAGAAVANGRGNFLPLFGEIGPGLTFGDLLDPTDFGLPFPELEDLPGDDNLPPFFSLGAPIARLSEEGFGIANPDNVGFYDLTNAILVFGLMGGKDPDGDPITYSLTPPAAPITANDMPLNWVGSGTNGLLGFANGVLVISVLVENTNGLTTVQLFQAIDHPLENVEDEIPLFFGVTITDTSGSSASTVFTIIVEDDGPEIMKTGEGESTQPLVTEVTVDEDELTGLSTGNSNDDSPGDAPNAGTSATGALNIAWGADRYDTADAPNGAPNNAVGPFVQDAQGGLLNGRAVYFDATTPILYAASETLNGQFLTSKGDKVVIKLSMDGSKLEGVVEADSESETQGRTVFEVTLSDDGTGKFTFRLFDQLDHADTTNVENDLDLTFNFVARDSDGDTTTGSFVVVVDDDMPKGPSIESAIKLMIDEDDIRTPWSEGTSPNTALEGGGDQSVTENVAGNVDPALVTGSLASFFPAASGADETVTYGIAGDAVAVFKALNLFSKQTANPDNGVALSYAQGVAGDWLTFTATEPDMVGDGVDGKNIVFEFRIHKTTGAFEFRLFDELIHAPANDQNTQLRSGGPGYYDLNNNGVYAASEYVAGGTTSVVDYLDFGKIITVTDYDQDTITLDGIVQISVKDDVPEAYIKLNDKHHDDDDFVQVDESGENDSSADNNTGSSSVRNLFKALEEATPNQEGNDPHVDGDTNGSTSGAGAIAYAQSDDPVVLTYGIEVGADAPAKQATITLGLFGANNQPATTSLDSGLKTTGGNTIMLETWNNLIVGRTLGNGTDPAGEVAFAIAIGNDGHVSVAQYLSLQHPDDEDHDESVDLSDIVGGTIRAVVTVVDSDDDVATDSVSIGNAVRFDDDGPWIKVERAEDHRGNDIKLGAVELDETTPGGDPNDNTPTTEWVASATVNPDNAIGRARSPADADGTSLSDLFDVDFDAGADGKKSLTLDYSLKLIDNDGSAANGPTDGVETSLRVTHADGTALDLGSSDRRIWLFQETDGSITGRIGIGSGTPDYVALRIFLTSGEDPQFVVEQYLPIEHPDDEENNESVVLKLLDKARIDLTLNATIVDGDDDTDFASKTITLIDKSSSIVEIDDDGPVIKSTTVTGSIIHDETPGDDGDHDVDATSALANLFTSVTQPGDDPHVAPSSGPIGYAQSSGALVTAVVDYGTDGRHDSQDLTYEIFIGSTALTGLQTTDGRNIELFRNSSGVIIGRYAPSGTNNPDNSSDEKAAFAIHIDADTGVVTVVQYMSIKHTDNTNHNDTKSLDLNNIVVKITAKDGDGDETDTTVKVGDKITFRDDGPTLTVSANGNAATLLKSELDETVGPDRYNTAIGETEDLNGNANTDDGSGYLGRVTTTINGGLTSLFTVGGAYGADGPGALSGTLSFTGIPQGGSIATNLFSTDGGAIVLQMSGAAVIGVDTQGVTVFRIEIVSVSGSPQLRTTLYEAIDHGDDGNKFDSELLLKTLSGSLGLKYEVTRTDAEGDSVTLSAQVDLANAGDGIISFDDDGPKVADKVCLVSGTTVGGANSNDLVYALVAGAGLTIAISDIADDASHENALGYYFLDSLGRPIIGAIIENTVDDNDPDRTLTLTPAQIPAGAVGLGFFVLPDGGDRNTLTDGQAVSFTQVGGYWKATTVGGQVLATADGYVLFSDRNLNPDLSPDGNTTPKDDFDANTKSGTTSYGKFEDTINNSDKDFNDVTFTVKVCATTTSLLAEVDEDGLPGHGVDDERDGEVVGTNSAIAQISSAAVHALVSYGSDGPHPTTPTLFVATTTPVAIGHTSQNAAIVVVTSGNVLTGYVEKGLAGSGYDSSSDRPVFTLTRNGDGSFTFELLDQIDHEPLTGTEEDNAENLLDEAIDLSQFIKAMDSDGDTVVLTSGTFLIQVRDDIPVPAVGLALLSGYVDEDDLKNNASQQDNSTGNPAEGNLPADGVDDVETFTAAQLANALIANVGADEPGKVLLALGMTGNVVDTGGNFVESKDKPVLWGTDGTTIVGYVEEGANSVFDPSTDRVVFRMTMALNGTLTFDLKDQIDHPNPQNLPLGPGDSATLELDLSAALRIEDDDGDSVPVSPGAFTMVVENDIPGNTNAHIQVGVAEDYLSKDTGASPKPDFADGVSADPVAPAFASDEIVITAAMLETLVFPGADNDVIFSLNKAVTGELDSLNGEGIFSNTLRVRLAYDAVSDKVVGYTNGAGGNALQYDSAVDKVIFEITDLGNGDFRFDLLDKIDHYDDVTGATGLGDAGQMILDISRALKATDSDGDVLVLGLQSIRVAVENDVPTAVIAAEAPELRVDETDIGTSSAIATAAAADFFDVDYGADGPGTIGNFSLSGVTGTDTGLVHTASNLAVQLVPMSGTVVYGMAGANHVFTLEIVAGQVKLTQHSAVKHADPDLTEHDEPTSPTTTNLITLHATVTDYDNDAVPVSVKLDALIVIEDDGPTLTVTARNDALPTLSTRTVLDETVDTGDRYNVTLGEPLTSDNNVNTDDLGDGIAQVTTNVAGAGLATLFDVVPDHGEDGPGVVTFQSIGFGSLPAGGLATNLQATTGGAIWIKRIDANTLVGIDNSGTGDTVFEIKIVDVSGSKQLQTTLFEAIRHTDANLHDSEAILQLVSGGPITLEATFRITDKEGDYTDGTGSLNLIGTGPSIFRFDDDGPKIISVTQAGTNLIDNPSFEVHPALGGAWAVFNQISGWEDGANGRPFEVQSGGAGGLAAFHGNALIELDANTGADTNATIQQTVDGLTAGQTYVLTFWYAPRPGDPAGNPSDSSSFNVLWNGSPVLSFDSSTAQPGWQQFTVNLTATGATGLLAFEADGNDNTYGALIDNVRLVQALDDEDTTLSPAIEIQDGPGDDGFGTEASGKITFDPGSDGLAEIRIDGITKVTGENGVDLQLPLEVIWVNDKGEGVPEDIVSQSWLPNGSGGGTLSLHSTNITNAILVTVDASGNYTVKVNAPLNHPLTDDPNTAGTQFEYEDNLTLQFGFTITDKDGDAVSSTFDVIVDDDTPDAVHTSHTTTEGAKASLNVILVIDTSGSMNADGDGIPGGLDRMALAKQAIANLLATTNATINQVMVIDFAQTVTVLTHGVDGPAWFNWSGADKAAVETFIDGMDHDDPGSNQTRISDALLAVMNNWGGGPSPATQTQLYFLSDGEPNPSGQSVDLTEQGVWEDFLAGTEPDNGGAPRVDYAFAVGIGANISLTTLEPIAWAPGNPALPAIQIVDATQLSASLQGSAPGNPQGNIFAEGSAYGADGGHIRTFTAEGLTFTYTPAGGSNPATVTVAGSSSNSYEIGTGLQFGQVTVHTDIGGRIIFNFVTNTFNQAGDWDYLAPETGVDDDADVEIFGYSIVDGDGDGATGSFSIIVNPSAVPTASLTQAFVDDDGLVAGAERPFVGDDAAGNADGDGTEATFGGILNHSFNGETPAATHPFSFTPMHGVNGVQVGTEQVNFSWNALNDTLTATISGGLRNGTALFTVVVTNQATGAYKVTLLQPVMHASRDGVDGDDTENNTSVNVTFRVTDTNADFSTNLLTINFDDDTPLATQTNDSGVEGTPITGTVAFDPGADGATVTHVNGTLLSFGSGGWSQSIPSAFGSLRIKANGEYELTKADDVYDNDGTASFTVTVTDTDGDSSTAALEVTVGDTIDPVTVSLSAEPTEFEGSNTILYTATLSGGHVANNAITVTLANGETIVIPAGQNSWTTTAATQPDDVYKDGATVTNSIVGAVEANGTQPGSLEHLAFNGAAVETVVSDTIDTVTVSLSAEPTEFEGSNTILYTATLSGGHVANNAITVTLANGETIVIPAGQNSWTTTAATQPDDVYKDGATVTNSIVGAVEANGTQPGSLEHLAFNGAAVETVVSDTIDTVTVSLSAEPTEFEGSNTILYTATLSGGHVANNAITVTLANGETIVIPAGQNSWTTTAATQPDDVYKDGATVTNSIVGAVEANGTQPGSLEHLAFNGAAVETVVSDTIDTVTVSLSAEPTEFEGSNTILYTATLSGGHVANNAITVTLANGETIVIPAGQNSWTTTAATQPDDVYKDGATVTNSIVGAVEANGTQPGSLEHLAFNGAAVETVVSDTIDTTYANLTAGAPTFNANGTTTVIYTVTLSAGLSPFTPKAGGDLLTFELDSGHVVTIGAGSTFGTVSAIYPAGTPSPVENSIVGQSGDEEYELLVATGSTNVSINTLPSGGGDIDLSLDEAAMDEVDDGLDLAPSSIEGTDPDSPAETDQETTGITFTATGETITVGFPDPEEIGSGWVAPTVSGLKAGFSIEWTLDGDELVGSLMEGSTDHGEAIRLALSGQTTATAGNTATPTVAATLTGPLEHALGTGDVTINDIRVVATDASGDQVFGTVDVTVADDTPLAANDSFDAMIGQSVGANNFHLTFLIDVSSSISTSQMRTAMAAFRDMTEAYLDGGGNVSVQVIRFGSAAGTSVVGHYSNYGTGTDINTLVSTLNTAATGSSTASLGPFDPNQGNTNYSAGLNLVRNYLQTIDADDGFNNAVYFFTDGDPNQGTIDTSGEMTAYLATDPDGAGPNQSFNGLIGSLDLEIHAFGVGSGVTAPILNAIDNTPASPVLVTNWENLVSGLLETVTPQDPAEGNVLFNDPGFGADGGYILSIEVDGEVYVYNPTTQTITIPSGAPGMGTGARLEVVTELGGTFVFQFAKLNPSQSEAGSWNYTAPDSLPGNASVPEVFDYVLVDGDGDTTAATLTVNVHPLPTLAVSSPTINEADGYAQFTVTLSHDLSASPIPVTFALGQVGDTATGGGTDYGAAFEWSLTGTGGWQTGPFAFAPETAQVFVRTPINNDLLDEANETFTLTATSTGATANPSAVGTATIIDNDDAVQFSINANSSAIEGTDATISFTVTKTGLTAFTTSVVYTVSTGTATGADYSGTLTDTVTFLPGETSKVITLNVTNDGAYEGNETFTVALSNPSANATINAGASSSAGTITDAPDLPVLTVSSPNVGEGAGFAEFTVSLNNASFEPVGFNLALANGSAAGLGVDYGAAGPANVQVFVGGTWVDATSATIAAGQTSVLVRTPIADDPAAEPAETFTLTATVTSGTTTAASAVGTATILASDTPPSITGFTAVTDASLGSVTSGASIFHELSGTGTWEAMMDLAQATRVGGWAGTLASPANAAQNTAINNYRVSDMANGSIWLGISDKLVEGQFLTYDGHVAGSATPYEAFDGVEPNNAGAGEDYAQMWSNSPAGSWNDGDGTQVLGALAEYSTTNVARLSAYETGYGFSTEVGTLTANLEGGTLAAGWALTSNPGGLFAIDAMTGVVTVVGNIDYETATTHAITATVTTNHGTSAPVAFTVHVINVNDAPVLALNATNNVQDLFSSANYSDSDDGSQPWTTSWDENGDNDNPASGEILITGGRLAFTQATDTNDSVERAIDLTGATAATLSFTWRLDNTDDNEDFVVEAWDGTQYDVIGTLDSNLSEDTDFTFSIALAAEYIGPHTSIRFRSTSGLDSNENVFFDNVKIAYVTGASLTGYTTSYTEGAAAVAITGVDVLIGDVDDANIESASIVLTNAQDGDRFTVNGTLIGAGGGTGTVLGLNYTVTAGMVITLTGAASLATYQSALATIQFSNVSQAPVAGARVINVTVNDGTENSNTAVATINVTAVNDAPVNTTSAQSAFNEDTSKAITGLQIADADAGAGSVTVTLTVTNGILNVSGGGATIANSGTAVVTLTGTVTQINATLAATVSFVPTADYNGSATLTMVTNDNGNTGSGGAQTDTDIVSLTITSAADIVADTVTTNEDTAISFNPITGTNGAEADNFEGSPQITHIAGTAITAGGGAVAVTGGSVTLAAGNVLTFTPTADYSGTPVFSYTVLSGGLSETANITVTVTAVNDAPELDASKSPVLSNVAEDAAAASGTVGTLVSALIDFASPSGQVDNVTDVDASPLLGIAVTGADTANGSWFYSINNGTNWLPLGSVSDGNARLLNADASTRLYFRPVADYNGTATITFRAWDRTSGSNGALVNVTVNGDATAFSASTDTATVTIAAVADIVADTVTTNEDTAISFNPITGTNGAEADNFEAPGPQITHVAGTAITAGGSAVSVTGGSVTLGAGNILTFTPNPDFNGAPVFTYTVLSGGVSETANITVTVNAVADIVADTVTTNEDTPISFNPITGTNGAEADNFEGSPQITHIAGTAITVGGAAVVVTGGSVTLGAGNVLTFTPNADYSGTPVFSYTVLSGGVSETANINMTVEPQTVTLQLRIDQSGAENNVDDLTFTNLQVLVNGASLTESIQSSTGLQGGATANTFVLGSGSGARSIVLNLGAHAAADDIQISFTYSSAAPASGEGPTFSLISSSGAGTFTQVIANYASTASYIGNQSSVSKTIGLNYSVTTAGMTLTSISDPIILDLDDNGVSFGSLANGAAFDINADGAADRVAWNTSSDGILAMDIDGDGIIDDGSEIFTPDFNGGGFKTGGEALASLDDNGDGIIDADDAAFAKLSIWQDANADGVTDAGELKSLAEHGIASIQAPANPVSTTIDGQEIIGEGIFTRTDGSTGGYVEVALETEFGFLSGGEDEVIIGEVGVIDTLTGTGGGDTFVLTDLDAVDVIADYDFGQGDAVDLSELLANIAPEDREGAVRIEGDSLQVNVDGSGFQNVATFEQPVTDIKIIANDGEDFSVHQI